MLKILFAASECVPFASSGGLGDVAAALPKALTALGHSCSRILPYYRKVDQWMEKQATEGRPVAEPTGMNFDIHMDGQFLTAEILHMVDETVPTYFVKFNGFFDRDGLYGESFGDYHDNVWRFTFFQKAVTAFMDAVAEPFDVVHANDWQTGLLPLLTLYGVMGNGRSRREASVFTIHNLAYQGHFPDFDFRLTDLPAECYGIRGMEFYGGMNFMKAGIATADQVTTVSEQYADEIKTDEFGLGMDGLLQYREDHLAGLLNGVDYDVWNPETDAFLPANYSAKDLSGKATCKQALLTRFGLPADSKKLLIGLVSRLATQKGFDLIGEAMPTLMQRDIQFVLLGSGTAEYEEACREWQKTWPDKFRCHIGFSHELAHQIEAGADAFLMPSTFEPCGLNQLYSLKYGTVPIVSGVGGLVDTVKDQVGKTNGTGFVMADYTVASLIEAVDRAVATWGNKRHWTALQKRGMAEDFSWEKSAKKYVALYQGILDE